MFIRLGSNKKASILLYFPLIFSHIVFTMLFGIKKCCYFSLNSFVVIFFQAKLYPTLLKIPFINNHGYFRQTIVNSIQQLWIHFVNGLPKSEIQINQKGLTFSHLACSLTTFQKSSLTFRQWNKNGKIINLKIHNLEKKLFFRGTLSQWCHCEVQIDCYAGNKFGGGVVSSTNRSLGLRECLKWTWKRKRI